MSIANNNETRFESAAAAISKASRLLWTVEGCFRDNGDCETSSSCLAETVRAAKELLNSAADDLGTIEEADHGEIGQRANMFRRRVWDAADVVRVLLWALEGDTGEDDYWPDGDGRTNSPLRGSFSLVIERLEALLAEIGEYVWTLAPPPVKAAA